MRKLLLLAPLVFAYACGRSDSSDVKSIETQVYILNEKVPVSDEINDLLTAAAQGQYNLNYLGGLEGEAIGLTKVSGRAFLSDDILMIKKDDVIRFDKIPDGGYDRKLLYEGIQVGTMMQSHPYRVQSLCTGFYTDICTIKYDSILGFSIELNDGKKAP